MDKLRDFLQSRLGKLLMVLCLSPLAFLGIDSYIHGNKDPNQVVKVGDDGISLSSYQNAVNARRSELLEHLSDASLLNEDVLQKQVLKGLIDRELLEQQVKKLGMTISDATITHLLQKEPVFQENGQFSNERFAEFLLNRGMSKEQLFSEFRNQLVVSQLNSNLVGTAIYPMSAINQLIDLQTETRDVWLYRISWKDFLNKVQVSDDEIKSYYDQNKQDLKSKAMVNLSYITLPLADIPEPEISEDDIEQQYTLFKQKNNAIDVREFSQILLTGDDAEKKAKMVKERLDKGEKFADLAKEFSDDPTGETGGAIGRFNPSVFGNDAPQVEKAIQGLSVGQVSEPVKTSFGYQIFTVTSDDGIKLPSIEEMRETLVVQAKDYKRRTAYAEKIARINDLSADGLSIEDIAQQEHLKVKQIRDYPKTDNHTLLSQPAVINAAFDEFNIQEQSVTTGIEVGEDVIWVQPSDYRPVHLLTLEQARPEIKNILEQQKATKLAVAEAEQIAQTIKSKDDLVTEGIMLQPLGKVNRQSVVLTDKERSLVFSKPAPADGLVAFAEETEHGASVLVADEIKIEPKSQLSADEKRQTANIVRDNLGQDQLQDYLEYLRLVYKVEIDESRLKGTL